MTKVVVVHSDRHALHDIARGLWVGVSIPTDEVPPRADAILAAMIEAGRDVVEPTVHDDGVLELVHDPAMIRYMRSAHQDWVEWGYPDDPGQANVVAYAFPTPGFLGGLPLRSPESPGARAGLYAMDTMTPIGPGTYLAARTAVDVAQTAAEMTASGRASYALCRPPGHHAGRSYYGGSCYLNNAAVAAETLRQEGIGNVGIVDLDAHHGNGTQEIFYARDDVGYGSVHVDPGAGWFPHFMGFPEETGRGDGEGANLNVALAPGSGDEPWLEGVDRLVEFVVGLGCEAIVVSLGVDAAVSDPESPLEITHDGYLEAGKRIASAALPTVFVQEGGYDLATIGPLVSATLRGYEGSVGGDFG